MSVSMKLNMEFGDVTLYFGGFWASPSSSVVWPSLVLRVSYCAVGAASRKGLFPEQPSPPPAWTADAHPLSIPHHAEQEVSEARR